MDNPVHPKPPERTDAARRVLNAAKRLFAERGFDGVSVRDIAEEAAVSKANVFHHFVSKWELYRAVMEESSAEYGMVLDRLEGPDSVAEVLAGFSEEHFKRLFDDPDATRLFIRQLLDSQNGESRQLAENLMEQSFATAVERLGELQAQGKLRADVDPSHLALLLGGVNVAAFQLQNVLRRLRASPSLEAPEALAASVARMLVEGVVP